MILFGLQPTRSIVDAVGMALEAEVGEVEVTTFEDGERRVRPLGDVAGRDVVVLQSVLGGPGEPGARCATPSSRSSG